MPLRMNLSSSSEKAEDCGRRREGQEVTSRLIPPRENADGKRETTWGVSQLWVFFMVEIHQEVKLWTVLFLKGNDNYHNSSATSRLEGFPTFIYLSPPKRKLETN